jgi:hypothetical protein
MPKLDTTTEWHVSLRTPMRVKMGGQSCTVVAFDATITGASDSHGLVGGRPWGNGAIEFQTHCLWVRVTASAAAAASRSPTPVGSVFDRVAFMRTTLIVPDDNIAGIVAQPFQEKP